MRTFVADTGYWDDGKVWVCWEGKRVGLLPLRLDIENKSPTGFAWGYGGSGPAQLAIALIAAVAGDVAAGDPRIYQRFKSGVIANLDQKRGWTLSEEQIKGAIAVIQKGEAA